MALETSVRTAVMQPTYLPWCGYFSLIDSVDTFIVLDDVQLTRPSWQTRNRIINHQGEPQWLSLDVVRAHGDETPLISDALLDDTHRWREKHLRAISLNYAKAPYRNTVLDLLEPILLGPASTVGRVNSEIIVGVCALVGLSTPLQYSSDLEISGSREERLLEMCRLTSATTYLSTPGSADYLELDGCRGLFEVGGVTIRYIDYACSQYAQGSGRQFIPQLSVVDHLAWLGPQVFKDHIQHADGAARH